MKARFDGGELDGRPFQLPRLDVPPRGLDVTHRGHVSRYRFERVDEAGEAVYSFTGGRAKLARSTRAIDVDAAFTAVPLQFYPSKKP